MFGFSGFDTGFGAIGVIDIVIFSLIFLPVLGIFVFVFVRAIRQGNKNNHSPQLTVEARVVSRRADTSLSQTPVAGDATGAHGFTTSSATTCYATFEVESGDRMEFVVPHAEYGYLAEGDSGRLTFQGTRFLGFERR